MQMIGRVLAGMIRLLTWVGMLAVILMMLQITIDGAGKYLFNAPIPATISMVSNYYMVVVAFIPIAYVETRNEHITVEVVTEFLPIRTRYHLYSWTYLLSAVVYGLLTYKTWMEANKSFQAGSFIVEQGYKVVIWPSYYLLPIGTGLMTAVLIYRWIIYITGAKSGLGEVKTV